jgi:hypothetical protein
MAEIEISTILRNLDDYIKSSAKNAAKFQKDNNLSWEAFPGTKITLTESMCEEVYKELIEDLIKAKTIGSAKFGLFACIIPGKQLPNGSHVIKFKLGMMFKEP